METGGKLIPLTQGKFAIVDDEDYDWLMQWRWHYCQGYARRTVHTPMIKGKRKTSVILMHREILKPEDGFDVDHRDTNGLNNRRYNLRPATKAKNQGNRKLTKGKSSQYKGVSWDKINKNWVANIMNNYKNHNIGRFHDEVSAAKAYNKAALEYFGEFALLNTFPESEIA